MRILPGERQGDPQTLVEAPYDAIIVGGGAAGIGAAVTLRDAGVENFIVLERLMVGASFASWPEETRFITPSFPTNSIGMLDLNSIALGTSPAFMLAVEHPTGEDYAVHLNAVAVHNELPIRQGIDVTRVTKESDVFLLETTKGPLRTKHLIWAAGEFQYPKLNGFHGARFAEHTSKIASYSKLEGDDFVIIGGYESGVDAAYHLARCGKKVRLIDRESPWDDGSSDPSVALSTYSHERMRSRRFKENVTLIPNTNVISLTRAEDKYELNTADGRSFETSTQPLLAGGFVGGHKLVSHLFGKRGDGFPLLSDNDESTIADGLFLVGPAVRHENHVFCFIYKYRQRFAVVAKAIASSLGLPAEKLETYRQWGMYLDDLSCCGEECVC